MVLDVLDAAFELDLELSVPTETRESPAVGPDPDQAAVDAEFVAIVLVDAPWGVSEAAPAPMPSRTTTTTRLASAPWRPRGYRDRAGARSLRRGGVREPGRRPRSVARSPPSSRSIDSRL